MFAPSYRDCGGAHLNCNDDDLKPSMSSRDLHLVRVLVPTATSMSTEEVAPESVRPDTRSSTTAERGLHRRHDRKTI